MSYSIVSCMPLFLMRKHPRNAANDKMEADPDCCAIQASDDL